MKHEAQLLLNKACDSLILAIEFFNRPYDLGRATSMLILMDHAFEMILKAAILHRGGRIREKRAPVTIGFEKCVRTALSDGTMKFLTEEQALTLQGINALRDAAQHHLLEISENQLYMYAQSGLTLFRDLMTHVFNRDLCQLIPNRVLPISTSAPIDLVLLFDSEISQIIRLLKPGSRKQLEAQARLRPLVLMDSSIKGEKEQPSPGKLQKIGKALSSGKKWQDIFPGVASIELTTSGSGPNLSLRWTKTEGAPIHVVPEGTPGASVVALKRVNELDFYNMSLHQLADKVNLTAPKTTAIVRYLKLEQDLDCFKLITIGKTAFKRYSQKAIEKIQTSLKTISIDEIWADYSPLRRKEINAHQTL